MDNRNQLKHRIIDKILASQDETLLSTIDTLISACEEPKKIVKLSPEQVRMLELSDRDLQDNAVISHEDLDEADLAWLREK